MLSPLVRERYPINYIYGFSSEGFSYFLTTQMKQTSPSPYESKIVRVCHDDSDYYSYTEVQEKNAKQGMLENGVVARLPVNSVLVN
jgi:plexin A